MNTQIAMRRGLLALAIAAAVSFAALAHETTYEETRIDVRTQVGAVETVIVGAMAPGESREITTIAGHPAVVTRGASGLTLALAGESFDVPLGDPEHDGVALPEGAKIVRIKKHVDAREIAAAERKHEKIVVRTHGGGDAEDIDVDEPGPLADGQRIRVIRQVRHEIARTSE